ncbi:MAG: ParB/RepB/Spo0J family partition protein [Peptococcaceae bacterium]|nr:ParB/RepB/Spo0J family partition protein [Peptococcaceae bacterium]
MNKKRGLGRGLEALLPGASVERDGRLKEISVDDVMPNPKQPRQVINDEKLAELAGSIKEHGIVQPVVVRSLADGKYELIAGERRWRAGRILGMKKIPAVIKDYGDLEAAAVALIENVQRENLNPLEEAGAYKTLMEEFGLTQEEVSKRVGKSRPFVGNMVRLLTLPDEIKQMLLENRLSSGHARAILGLSEKSRQVEAARKIIKNQMNVRQAEQLVKNMSTVRAGVRKTRGKSKDCLLLERDLNAVLSARVKVSEASGGGGRVVMDFKDKEEMIRFLSWLKEKRNALPS